MVPVRLPPPSGAFYCGDLMPKPKSHVTTPLTFAEAIQDKLIAVPGDRTAFLKFRRNNQSFALETYLSNSPECDRLRSPSSSTRDVLYVEVGTYRKGISTRAITEDVTDAMARVR